MNPTSARIKSKKKRIVEHRNRDLTYRHCGRVDKKPFECQCGKKAIEVHSNITNCVRPLSLP